jgi:hypothetical protein
MFFTESYKGTVKTPARIFVGLLWLLDLVPVDCIEPALPAISAKPINSNVPSVADVGALLGCADCTNRLHQPYFP